MKPLNILGLTIFSAGILLLAGFGFYEFLKDTTVPLVVRWGSAGLILGVLIILISLIIERRKDKQKEQQLVTPNKEKGIG